MNPNYQKKKSELRIEKKKWQKTEKAVEWGFQQNKIINKYRKQKIKKNKNKRNFYWDI